MVVALVLGVAASVALQVPLGLGRTGPWAIRYPIQNTVLIIAVLLLHESTAVDGGLVAILLATLVTATFAAVVLWPIVRAPGAPVPIPDGALRFGALHASGAALLQIVHRGGVVLVAVLAGASAEAGYTALATGLGLGVTYAVLQAFTVSLPHLAGPDATSAGAEPVLHRLATVLLAVLLPLMLVVAVGLDHRAGSSARATATPSPRSDQCSPSSSSLRSGACSVQSAALRLRPEVALADGWRTAAFVADRPRRRCPHGEQRVGPLAALGRRRGGTRRVAPAPPWRGERVAQRRVAARGRGRVRGGRALVSPNGARVAVARAETRDRRNALARCLRPSKHRSGRGARGRGRRSLAGSGRRGRGRGRRWRVSPSCGPRATARPRTQRGAAAAEGCDLIAFTDDDCVPSAGWLAALVSVADAGAEAVAGPTQCAPGASAADRAAQTITDRLLDESRARAGPPSTSRRPATWPTGLPSTPPCPSTRTSRWPPAKTATGVAARRLRQDHRLRAGRTRRAPASPLTVGRFWSQQRRYGRGAQRYRTAGGPERRRPPITLYGRLLARGPAGPGGGGAGRGRAGGDRGGGGEAERAETSGGSPAVTVE